MEAKDKLESEVLCVRVWGERVCARRASSSSVRGVAPVSGAGGGAGRTVARGTGELKVEVEGAAGKKEKEAARGLSELPWRRGVRSLVEGTIVESRRGVRRRQEIRKTQHVRRPSLRAIRVSQPRFQRFRMIRPHSSPQPQLTAPSMAEPLKKKQKKDKATCVLSCNPAFPS